MFIFYHFLKLKFYVINKKVEKMKKAWTKLKTHTTHKTRKIVPKPSRILNVHDTHYSICLFWFHGQKYTLDMLCYFFFLLVGGIGYVSMNRIRKCRDNMIWSSGFIIANMVQNNVIETIFRRIWYVMWFMCIIFILFYVNL